LAAGAPAPPTLACPAPPLAPARPVAGAPPLELPLTPAPIGMLTVPPPCPAAVGGGTLAPPRPAAELPAMGPRVAGEPLSLEPHAALNSAIATISWMRALTH
jgi:hypothetical protein